MITTPKGPDPEPKPVLYTGSGLSIDLVDQLDRDSYILCSLNNSWQRHQYSDYWIHPGDFPRKDYATKDRYGKEICYKDYSVAIDRAATKLDWVTKSPQHYSGYTSFFNGLYWIMMTLRPKKIGLLGADHSYNSKKLDKWKEAKMPAIHNKFNGMDADTWADEFFKDCEKDSFYGHGTPDPLRLGEHTILSKFAIAEQSAKALGIELVNLSPDTTGLNTLPKQDIKDFT